MMTQLVPKEVILKKALLTPLRLSCRKTFRMLIKTFRRLKREILKRMTTIMMIFISLLHKTKPKNKNLLSPGKVFYF